MDCLWHMTSQFPTALLGLALLPDANNDIRIFKNLHRQRLLSKQCVGGTACISIAYRDKKRPTRGIYCNLTLICHTQILYEMAPIPKGPLIREQLVKISWKSQRLSLLERSFKWYFFKPNPSRWTVPLKRERQMSLSLIYIFSSHY
jgi:hypothetical protein